MNEINKLFGVNIEDITHLLLADNKWYRVANTLSITGTFGQRPQYFHCWARNLSTNAVEDIVGNISQILLARIKTPKLRKVIKRWDEVVAKVSENGTSIGTFFAHGKPIELSGKRLTIGFPKKYKFQLDVLKKNVIRIETSIMKVLDQEMRVEFVLVESEEAPIEKTEETHLEMILDNGDDRVTEKYDFSAPWQQDFSKRLEKIEERMAEKEILEVPQ